MKKNFFKDKTVFVTGGTGSFGKAFVNFLLKNYDVKKIIIFSRDELKQFDMRNELINFEKKLRFFLGDVRDFQRVKLAIKDADIVIHAAALKQVNTAEYNPFEFIKTNIIGTQNIIDAIGESNVSKSILLSTDKAAAPINLYGATKLAADKLFIAANNYTKKKFSVVRYGNVFMSRGSIVPEILKQKESAKIKLTDKRMTRFSILLDEGVNFVIQSLHKMWGGEIFIPKIPSYNLSDLAKAFAPECKVIYTGIRPGEKLHEEMITNSDSYYSVEFQDSYAILPSNMEYLSWSKKDFIKKFKGKTCKVAFSYNSLDNKNFLSVKELKKFLLK
jgi:UDP-N-acetylglucosamine 4,6-dehydratase (inverting)